MFGGTQPHRSSDDLARGSRACSLGNSGDEEVCALGAAAGASRSYGEEDAGARLKTVCPRGSLSGYPLRHSHERRVLRQPRSAHTTNQLPSPTNEPDTRMVISST